MAADRDPAAGCCGSGGASFWPAADPLAKAPTVSTRDHNALELFRRKCFYPTRRWARLKIFKEGRNRESTGGSGFRGNHDSDRNSYSSITAATASLPLGPPSSSRTTVPLHFTRMLSVRVISAGSVNVNSIGEPVAIGEST